MFIHKEGDMLNFRAAGNRCLVDFEGISYELAGDISAKMIEDCLIELGFKVSSQVVPANVVRIARSMIGRAQYKRGTRFATAKERVFDCSTFTKWVYAQLGAWLPRLAVQQMKATWINSCALEQARMGDLIFRSGFFNFYDDGPKRGIGHVGIVAGKNTVIHANNKSRGVSEDPTDLFLGSKARFRGVSSVLLPGRQLVTLSWPEGTKEIDSSDCIFFMLQAHLRKKDKHKKSR